MSSSVRRAPSISAWTRFVIRSSDGLRRRCAARLAPIDAVQVLFHLKAKACSGGTSAASPPPTNCSRPWRLGALRLWHTHDV